METTRLFFRVDRRQINFVRFIFEAYEGLAVVTTLDAATGHIGLAVAPGCEEMAGRIMEDLGRQIRIEAMEGVDGEIVY